MRLLQYAVRGDNEHLVDYNGNHITVGTDSSESGQLAFNRVDDATHHQVERRHRRPTLPGVDGCITAMMVQRLTQVDLSCRTTALKNPILHLCGLVHLQGGANAACPR